MISIKKVAVTPIPENTGTIIDSLNTTDDKHTNAPSIEAVNNGLANHTHTKSQITDFAHSHTKSQITDFAHTHDDRYYTETEMNSKLGEKFNSANVKLLTGTTTFNDNGMASVELNYPSGFTQSNTMPVSLVYLGQGSAYWCDSVGSVELSSSVIGIALAGGTAGTSTTYRLLLMKV